MIFAVNEVVGKPYFPYRGTCMTCNSMKTSPVSRADHIQDRLLQIRCCLDVKIAFKTLAAKLDENYENTLKRLMDLEKDNPLQKKAKGVIERL